MTSRWSSWLSNGSAAGAQRPRLHAQAVGQLGDQTAEGADLGSERGKPVTLVQAHVPDPGELGWRVG